MKHQLIPNTDLNVSSYCYGVMFFGTRAKGDDAYRLYEQFVEAGGNLFDTAHGYACWMPEGDGASEDVYKRQTARSVSAAATCLSQPLPSPTPSRPPLAAYVRVRVCW